jgi:catalase
MMRISNNKFMAIRYLRRSGTATAFLITLGGPVLAQAPAPQPIPPNQSPQDLVNALHAAFGTHHARAVHAKGLILEGTFTPAKEARTLSKAPVFAGASSPVVVRFSNFTGIPDIPDNIGDANPRGFAVKIRTKGGADTDIVAHSFNGFPVATSDEFAVLLRDIGASGPAVAHPNPVERFLASHPVAKTFLTTQKTPASYATTPYFGVNAFKYTDAGNRSVHVRYRFTPHAGAHYLTPAELKAKGPNYLQEEIRRRVMTGPIAFDWYAQIAEKGDRIADPSIAWPESRRLVKLGVITVNKLAADEGAADKQTLFMPGSPHPGIEAADPMLTIRNGAYPISFSGRQ